MNFSLFFKFITVVNKQYFKQKIYDVILKKTCGKYARFDLKCTISVLLLRINYGNPPEELLLVVSVVGISSIVVVVEVLVCVSICAKSSHLGSCSWKTSGNYLKEYWNRLLIANVSAITATYCEFIFRAYVFCASKSLEPLLFIYCFHFRFNSIFTS